MTVDDRWKRSILAQTVLPGPVSTGGVRVTVRVRIDSRAPVMSVLIRLIRNGVDHHVEATVEQRGERFTWYAAAFELRQSKCHYHILVRTSDARTWYYNRRGVSATYPNEDYDFTVNTETRIPSWVASAVFYQIFPDRFCRADPTLGVRDGEITRDHFVSREMAWDEQPLAYPEGGSLDFFNGDLPGIASKLDYLVDLGVNALYLTPIFTAKTNHRYDCLDYFSVDRHLGGDSALASLTSQAHKRGVRVMLDVSINHIGIEHAWATGMPLADGRVVDVVARNDDGSAVTWAGVAELLKLDYAVRELRDRVYRDRDSVIRRYLEPPFEIDGWRFDVASEVGNHAEVQVGHDVWKEIRSVIRRVNPDAYIVGEHWHDSREYLEGDEWDSAMNYFACGRPLRMWGGEQDRFAQVPNREALPGTPPSGDELATLISQHFDRIPCEALPGQFNLIDSHDTTRFHTNPGYDVDVYAGMVMMMFLLPGTCCVYYGDEIGLPGSVDGDHGKRFPMRWDDPGDERFRSLYRAMAALKRSEPALAHGAHRTLASATEHLVFARFDRDTAFVLVLNRCAEATTVDVDLDAIGAVVCRDAHSGEALEMSDRGVSVALRARQSRLLRCRLEV